jgi:hypothetical protein
MKYLLIIRIRCRQALRALGGVGWLWVILLPLLFIFSLSILNQLREVHPIHVALFAALPAAGIHLQRTDCDFLQKSGYRPYTVFFLEYGLLSLLITLPHAGFFDSWVAIPAGVAFCLLVAFLPSGMNQRKAQRSWQLGFLPPPFYEWKAFIRQYGWLIALAYLSGLIGARWIAPPLLAILFLSAFLPAAFDQSDPKEWLENQFMPSGSLRRKCLLFSVCWGLFLLPFLITSLCWMVPYWYLIAVAIAISIFYLNFLILFKYASYLPGRQKIHSNIITGLMGIGLLIPFTAPVCLVYIVILYRRAQRRIQYFTSL